MSLINFSQIKGGKKAIEDLKKLVGFGNEDLTALVGSKVEVTIPRKQEDGSSLDEVISVEDYLKEIEAAIGGGDGSLVDRVEAAEVALNREVKDRVRVLGTVDAAGLGTVSTLLYNKVVAGAYNVYSNENRKLVDAAGADLTATVVEGSKEPLTAATVTFSGIPHNKVVTYTNAAGGVPTEEELKDGNVFEKVEYVQVTDGTGFKVYPVTSFKLGEFPEDSLLDNEELALVAYGEAIEDLASDLAKDTAIIQEIIAKVQTLAVDEVIKQITDALDKRLDSLEALKTVHVAVDISGLEVTVVEDENRVDVTNVAVPFTAEVVTVTDQKAILAVNGVSYFEDKAFTLDRAAKTVTWTAAETLFHIESDFELTLIAEISTLVLPS